MLLVALTAAFSAALSAQQAQPSPAAAAPAPQLAQPDSGASAPTAQSDPPSAAPSPTAPPQAKPAADSSSPSDPLVQQLARLHALASELKSEVDKTTPYILSVTVIRKADAVEKMARGMKDKAKQVNVQEGGHP